MPLSDLTTPPPAVRNAAELISRIDQAFLGGFARLGADHLATLETLDHAFAGTPLGNALTQAIAGIRRSEFLDRHFLVIAAARSALAGAQHDALLAQAASALDRPAPALANIATGAAQAPRPEIAVWLESTRHWLMELALAGFANLGVDALLPFHATLSALQAEGRLARHAALLGGFLDELLAVFPARGTPEIPLGRWVDLWSRAMVLAADVPPPVATRPVSGALRLLAADLRQHATFASLTAFGVLREAGGAPPRIVRATLSAFKVDVIQGDELALLFGEVGHTLLEALTSTKEITLKEMPLTSTNDLVWDDTRAKQGAKFALIEEASKSLSPPPAERPALEPIDRHPALIEELVYLTGYEASASDLHQIRIQGAALPVDHERWPDTKDLLPSDIAGSAGIIGLLRFDAGRWSLSPLVIDKKKASPRMIGTSLGEGRGLKSKMQSLATLKERASKLLRKKTG